jgi:FKBP-type peptidyl-prolyl cis-trans isomerase 2
VCYVHGANGPLFGKIEQALEGMHVGDKAEVTLPPQHRQLNCIKRAEAGGEP